MQLEELILSWSLHQPENKNPALFDFRLYVEIYLDFIKSHNLTPTYIGLVGSGYGKNVIKRFPKGLKELNSNDYKKLDMVSIYTSEPDSKDYAFYWKTMFYIGCSDILGAHCFLGVNMKHVELKDDLFHATVKPISDVFQPIIGYAYVAPLESGPFSYSMGGVHTMHNDYLSEEQKELRFMWARYQDSVIHGKLRDLYQFNILSDAHLRHAINGTNFHEWIHSKSIERGDLKTLSNINTLWTVNRENYYLIRKQLFDAGMLIAYDEHIIPTILL